MMSQRTFPRCFGYLAITSLVPLLAVACAGNGGGGIRMDLDLVDPVTVQSIIREARPPDFTAQEIAENATTLLNNADVFIVGNHYKVEGDEIIENFPYTNFITECAGNSCTHPGRSEQRDKAKVLDNTIGGVEGLKDRIKPIATHNGVPLTHKSHSLQRATDSDVNQYGGWLGNGFFSIATNHHTVLEMGEEKPSITIVNAFIGVESGSVPTVDATWTGVMVGVDVSTARARKIEPIQGDALVSFVLDNGNPEIDVYFTDIYNLAEGTQLDDMSWTRMTPNNENGRFEMQDESRALTGSFFGDAHQEVGGVFEDGHIRGAFGATNRQP